MSDYIETLWAQFVIESQEHLELIEPILVEAEFDTPNKESVDQLFRSFHSIKGLSKAMDLIGMEAIAHRAEDILGLVRDEIIVVGAELADALISSIDALKQHLQFAESQRKDQAPDEVLISRLETIFNNAKGGLEKPCNETTELDDSAEIDDTPKPLSESGTSSIHHDPDMVIFFAELLQSNLPKIAEIIGPESSEELLASQELLGDLETLIHASTTMEFSPLADAFSSILILLSEQDGDKALRHESMIEAMMIVVDLTRLIESQVQQDCGLENLVTHLRICAAEMIDGLFQELTAQLQTIGANSEGKSLNESPEVIDLAIQTAEKACLLNNRLSVLDGNDGSKQLLMTVSEACNYINQGHAVLESDLIKLLINAVGEAESEYRLDKVDGGVQDHLVDWNTLNQKIWDVIKLQRTDTSIEELDSFKELAGKVKINPIFEDCMPAESIRLLRNGIDEGYAVYEALVNLEESETFTASFLHWIEEHAQLITNSTIFVDDKPWSNCLLLTQKPDNVLRESVNVLDPERQFLTLEVCALVADKPPVDTTATASSSVKEPSTGSKDSSVGNKDTSVLRVNGTTLDQFMSQIGELVSLRGTLHHTVHMEKTGLAINAIKQLCSGQSRDDFNSEYYLEQLEVLEQQLLSFDQIDQKMNTVLSLLQDSALALRVVPMETVFKRLPRPVRDLAQSQGKKVKLEIIGQEVRIDKAMVESLSDPLMHMVRNSVDHGIELPEERIAVGKPERAVVGLEARQQGNTVQVTITDDGRGIGVEAVKKKALSKGLVSKTDLNKMSDEDIMQFIFSPGFSTADCISETSGRGVGMDVVRTNVLKLGGSVVVSSEAGKGSKFTLELPLSVAIQDTVLVQASGHMMAIPERYVSEMIEIRRSEVQSVNGCQAIVLRDNFLPVYMLGPLLGYQSAVGEDEELMVVAVISDGKQRVGVVIDRSYQRQELFIKDIHDQLTALPGVSGAAILGNGKVVLILDVEDLFILASKHGKTALLTLDIGSHIDKVFDRDVSVPVDAASETEPLIATGRVA